MEKNEIFDTIMARTSVRSYTSQPIKEDKIEMLLRAGMAAPSACNKQPWHFIAITNREILDQIPSFSPYASMVKQAPRHRGMRRLEQDLRRQGARVLDSRLLCCHREHSLDGTRPASWSRMDSPLSTPRPLSRDAATFESSSPSRPFQHPHHRISEGNDKA